MEASSIGASNFWCLRAGWFRPDFFRLQAGRFWFLRLPLSETQKKNVYNKYKSNQTKKFKSLKPFSSSLTFLLIDTAAMLELSSSLSINFAGLFRLRTGRIWRLGLWLSETFKNMTISKPKYWRKQIRGSIKNRTECP